MSTQPTTPRPLRVGLVGHAFMGRAHSHAWRTAGRFFDLPLAPQLTAVAGRDERAVTAAAQRLGWDSAETDWRRLVERPDVDLVDICTPGDTHVEIAVAALRAGKHVLCEKPLANSVAGAELTTAAAEEAGRPARAVGGARLDGAQDALHLQRVGERGRRLAPLGDRLHEVHDLVGERVLVAQPVARRPPVADVATTTVERPGGAAQA